MFYEMCLKAGGLILSMIVLGVLEVWTLVSVVIWFIGDQPPTLLMAPALNEWPRPIIVVFVVVEFALPQLVLRTWNNLGFAAFLDYWFGRYQSS